jgi:hypothetical protein
VDLEVDFLLGRHETLLIHVGTNEGRLIVVVTHSLRRVGSNNRTPQVLIQVQCMVVWSRGKELTRRQSWRKTIRSDLFGRHSMHSPLAVSDEEQVTYVVPCRSQRKSEWCAGKQGTKEVVITASHDLPSEAEA